MVQTVRLNGNDVAYRLDGPADAPVILFANSLAADMTMWDDNLEAVTRNYRALRYDVRGHGATAPLPAPYSMADLVQDAVALLDALGIDKVHFVGLSLGGMFGQLFGATHPERLRSLTLCDTASEHTVRDAWQTRIDMVRHGGVVAVTEGTLQRWFTPHLHARAPHTIKRVRSMILRTSDEGYIGCATAIRDLNHTGLLRRITAPTLVLVGEQDTGATVAQARIIEQNIRGASLVILKDAAHLANIEQPAAFDHALLAFLDSLNPASSS